LVEKPICCLKKNGVGKRAQQTDCRNLIACKVHNKTIIGQQWPEGKLVMDKLIKSFQSVVSAEFSVLAMPALKKAFEVAFKGHFKGLEKKARSAEFLKFRNEAKKAVSFDGLNARQKNTVNVRLWRAGKLVGIKLGKTPKRPPRPPKPPTTPPTDGNGENVNGVTDGLSSKAPREVAAAWKRIAQAIKEKTGWNFARFEKEALPIIKAILK
jgi:hypothetical protein